MKRRSEMTWLERLYILEVIRGVTLTFGKLIINFTQHVFELVGLRALNKLIGKVIGGLVGIKEDEHPSATIQYPNERIPYAPRFRGRHRLTLKKDGAVKCESCFLCSTACPAKCIYIEPQEHDDPRVEKFPNRFEIDTLLCIYCGYCVEACPVDAIRMDTGIHPEVYRPDPRAFIEDKETLMERSRELEDQGIDKVFADHMEKMQDVERDPFGRKHGECSKR